MKIFMDGNNNCIFCKIIAGELPSEKVYEDEKMLAFRDINPAAPAHIVCVPKIHIDSLNEVNANHENTGYVSHILEKIPGIAETLGLSNGYRVIINIGEDGGQTVKHLHFHMLGGKKLPVKLG